MPSSISLATLATALRNELPLQPGMQWQLETAIREAGLVSGRLIRGRIVAAGAIRHGVSPAESLQLAVAVEYFHLASLLLDDLPCMDDARMRRGHICLHRRFGEGVTILVALAFINRAYVLIGRALTRQPADVRQAAQACIESVLGPTGLVGGQARDLCFTPDAGSARSIGRVAAEKTAALFRLALVFPALAARPSAEERRLLNALSLYLGLAYQSADDLMDLFSDEQETGKTVGRDRHLGRPNLALMIGEAAVRRRLLRYDRLVQRTVDRLKTLHVRWSYLQEVVALLRPVTAESLPPLDQITAA